MSDLRRLCVAGAAPRWRTASDGDSQVPGRGAASCQEAAFPLSLPGYTQDLGPGRDPRELTEEEPGPPEALVEIVQERMGHSRLG